MKMGELTKAGLQIEQQKEQTAMQHNAEVGKMKMQWDKIHPNESMPAEFGQFMRVNPQNGFLDIVGQMQQAAQPQAEQAPTRPQGMQAQAQSLPATPKVPSMATKPKAQETKATAPKQIAENYVKSKGIGMTELKAKAWALAQKKGYTYSEFHALWKKQGI